MEDVKAKVQGMDEQKRKTVGSESSSPLRHLGCALGCVPCCSGAQEKGLTA